MLILMDTALSLLNVNEPIYPLDIVKHMRDQRPCMVQNVVSNIEKSNHLKYEAHYRKDNEFPMSIRIENVFRVFSHVLNRLNLLYCSHNPSNIFVIFVIFSVSIQIHM